MTPKPDDRSKQIAAVVTDVEGDETSSDASAASLKDAILNGSPEKSECERLYGPYPDPTPTPFLTVLNEGREGQLPDESIMALVKEEAMNPETGAFDTASLPCDVRDVGTPDEWVKRDGRLVRLTGKHPFNVEPPAAVLQQFKFITPPALHYVRNHGACPKLNWNTHVVHVGNTEAGPDACTPRPFTISMPELEQFPVQRELPVTLVCAGNRRKEQNMIRQTIGFNWGASGVGTNVYKGVPLHILLTKAGVSADPLSWADKHVEFVGVEDLPNKVGPGPFVAEGETWGKLVKYGTSLPLARCMNPAYDILIAYEANGLRLQPDHGFPVRLIIPGYIGGRMIKWLATIRVLPHETRNHYHYHDNRILPPQITAEESLTGGWWYKPEYIFNELNINSAVTSPDHNSTISIQKSIQHTFDVEGYAYTGGGRAISRVEVSVDNGVHWELAEMTRTEKPTPYGMYWCWIWWKYTMPVANLVGAHELIVRAWDESNNPQPMNPTWNLMGMGNNHAFVVKIHVDKTADGEHVFRFEHPTQPGQQTGGWMTKVATKPVSAGFGKLLEVLDASTDPAAAAPAPTQQTGPAVKLFTMAEVEAHNTEKDCWIIVKDRVYDCTEYLDLHPGGIESIVINGGTDATEDFVAIHSMKATKMLEKYYIGNLDTNSKSAVSSTTRPEEPEIVDAATGRKVALNPKKKTPFKLQARTQLSRDSFMLDFALPTPEHLLGLPTGKHMFLSAKINDELVLRRYTPISSNHDLGCVRFVIKAYYPCERFPEGGKMSQYLDNLKVGDYLDFKGPVGEFEYSANGNFTIDGTSGHATHFNMIAGGTGITPIMQIASEILRHPEDPTTMTVIFGAREEGDLLMRETLEEFIEKFPGKFQVQYILSDRWPADWKYSTGFVDKALFEEYLKPAGDTVYNLMCGPPIMIDKGCIPNLSALGHAKGKMFAF
jgi:nitrate reductase (NAD(P)H)